MDSTTQETLELFKNLASNPELLKATFNQPASSTTGLQAYDLSAPSKKLYPILTPLRNSIPRVGGGFAGQANWKAVTGINSGKKTAGVSEGKRGRRIEVTTADYNAVYRGIGLESSASFEAVYAGRTFEDILALSKKVALEALMREEERLILGGNGSSGIALGTPSAPSGTASSGGSMTLRTVVCKVVALTLEGLNQSTVSGGVKTSASETNADGTTDTIKFGSSNISAGSTGVSVAAGQQVTWTVSAVRGAFGYAWYTGVAGSEKLAAITTVNKFVQTADEGGSAQAATAITADNSQDSSVFDGILTQVVKSGNNGYYKSLNAATLTADGKGGIVEFDELLRDRWDNYRLSPDTIHMNAKQAMDATSKILAGGSQPIFRIDVEQAQADIAGGGNVRTYLNPVTGQKLSIKVHPDMPNGTVLFTSSSLPYPLADVPSVWQIKTRQDYFSIDWPITTRQYDFGVYADEVLQGFFPAANGVLTDVAEG